MSFPTIPVIDDFNRANGAVGADWTLSNFADLGSPPQISANGVAPGNDYAVLFNDVAQYGPNVAASIEAVVMTTSAADVNFLLVRASALDIVTATGYFVGFDKHNSIMTIARLDAGPSIVTLGAPIAQALADGDTIGITAAGDQISAWRKSGGLWTLLGTRTDSTYVAAGYAAFYPSSAIETASQWDNFSAGTIPEAQRYLPCRRVA